MVVPNSNSREQTLKLMKEKDVIEKQIADFGQILESNDNVGMSGPLIDAEGFPRNDIDVYQVRHARNQIVCLQNDFKEIMKQIEISLHQVHEEARNEQGEGGLSTKTSGMSLQDETTEEHCFVVVNLVSPGSPAEDAGIRLNDTIYEFGSINISNFHNDMTKIAQLVKNMENQRITLKLFRENERKTVYLTPKAWRGQGLLGCNMKLINK